MKHDVKMSKDKTKPANKRVIKTAITTDQLQQQQQQENDKQMVGGCCVCGDDMAFDNNLLVYCDGIGCQVAVHQGCYGIVNIPEGDWFCKRCEYIQSKQQQQQNLDEIVNIFLFYNVNLC